MRQDFRTFFHLLIIAQIFCLSFLGVGCGFKDDPFNPKENTTERKNFEDARFAIEYLNGFKDV